MDPVAALREIAYYKDRAREEPRRVMAYRRAADVVEALDDAERDRLGQTNGWQSLTGVGPKTAKVIAEAWSGQVPELLIELRSGAPDLGGGEIRTALRGDLHLHSNWSDGSARIEEMMLAAQSLGHEYCALTDHSPRLKIANGLSPERLRAQLDVIDELREKLAPMRILTGIEVDILEDGSLDQEPELLERLDIVVASVHSKLSMDAASMTRRMVRAVSNPHADVLGHCTGRLVDGNRGLRPESKFDAEKVFTACRDHGTAVEINSRPERRDPPRRLMDLALQIGCVFSIDTDAHAPGQLEFLGLWRSACAGRQRAGGAHRQHLARRSAAGLEPRLSALRVRHGVELLSQIAVGSLHRACEHSGADEARQCGRSAIGIAVPLGEHVEEVTDPLVVYGAQPRVVALRRFTQHRGRQARAEVVVTQPVQRPISFAQRRHRQRERRFARLVHEIILRREMVVETPVGEPRIGHHLGDADAVDSAFCE